MRSSVLAIFEATLSKRLESTARRTPSKVRSAPLAVSFLATVPVSLYVCPFISTIRLPFAERTTDAPGSMTTVVKLDSTIAGPSTRSPAAIA